MHQAGERGIAINNQAAGSDRQGRLSHLLDDLPIRLGCVLQGINPRSRRILHDDGVDRAAADRVQRLLGLGQPPLRLGQLTLQGNHFAIRPHHPPLIAALNACVSDRSPMA